MIVSFADQEEKHHGGIYQAGGWTYTGTSNSELKFFHNGRWKHRRDVVSKVTFGKQKKQLDYKALPSKLCLGKHRYLMPLDAEMRAKIAPLAKPYPKRPQQAMAGDHPEQRQCNTDPDAPSSPADMA